MKSLCLLMSLLLLFPCMAWAENSVDYLLKKSAELRLELEESARDCVLFRYDKNLTNTIFLKAGFLTDISLERGEELEHIALGNEMLFDVTTHKNSMGDWHIYVKPVEKNADTNMVISSDRRNYQVRLIAGNVYFPMVRWNKMGQADGHRVREVQNVQDLNFGYSLSPRKHEINILDDKHANTYLVFGSGKPDSINPLILSEGKDGDLEIVQYEKNGNTLVIGRILDNFVMKIKNTWIKVHRLRNTK